MLDGDVVGELQLLSAVEFEKKWARQAATLGLEVDDHEELALFEIANVVTGQRLGTNRPQMSRAEAEQLLIENVRDPDHPFWRILVCVRFPEEPLV